MCIWAFALTLRKLIVILSIGRRNRLSAAKSQCNSTPTAARRRARPSINSATTDLWHIFDYFKWNTSMDRLHNDKWPSRFTPYMLPCLRPPRVTASIFHEEIRSNKNICSMWISETPARQETWWNISFFFVSAEGECPLECHIKMIEQWTQWL